MSDRELLAQLAYAVMEGKWTEARSLAEEFYRRANDETGTDAKVPVFGLQTLEGTIPPR